MTGVPASPSGHSRAEPEEVSALRASVLNAAWTPGPWMVEEGLAPDDLQRPWVQQQAKPHHYVALACGDDTRNSYDNARLIASAPELYAVADDARMFVELVRMRAAREGDEDQAREAAEALAGIVAALAKARGDAL